MTKETFTLADIAERWCCCHSTVLAHVRSGRLPAIDISTNPSKRSRYVVRANDLEEFEHRRTVAPIEVTPKRRRARIRPSQILDIIK